MADDFEYFDEAGNRIDSNDLMGVEYEVVEGQQPGQPAPTAAAGGGRISKGVIFGVLALVVLVGGGAAFGLSQLGNTDTAVTDVQTKVATKKKEIIDEVRPELDACDGTQIKKAAWVRGDSKPSLQLKVVDSVALPPGFAERTAAAADPTEETTLFQFGDRTLGIYDENPKATVPEGRWWKVTAHTDPKLAVTGEAQGGGRDKNAVTACTSVTGGVYRVVGEGIPATSREMQDDLVQVSVLKGDGVDADTVWAVVGAQLLKTTLEYTPDADDGGE